MTPSKCLQVWDNTDLGSQGKLRISSKISCTTYITFTNQDFQFDGNIKCVLFPSWFTPVSFEIGLNELYLLVERYSAWRLAHSWYLVLISHQVSLPSVIVRLIFTVSRSVHHTSVIILSVRCSDNFLVCGNWFDNSSNIHFYLTRSWESLYI